MSFVERLSQPSVANLSRRYNIAPGDAIATRIEDATRPLRWGLLAPWRGHGGVRPPPIHRATRAQVAATPILRKAIPATVHADGFFARTKHGSRTRAWWIHTETPGVHGLVATHRDDGVEAVAILVEPAPAAIAAYTDIAPILVAGTWRATEVSRWFEDLAHDDAACIAPLGNPRQGELF